MKKNIVIIILVVIIAALCGVLGWVLGVKSTNKEKEATIPKEEIKEQNFDLVEAKKLVDQYTLNEFYFYESMFENKMSDKYKVYLAIANTKEANIKYDCETAFPDGEYISETQYNAMKNGIGICYDLPAFKYDDLNKSYKKLFGSDSDMPKIEMFVMYSRYAYSETYDAYISLSCECGGAPARMSYYDVVDAKVTGDNLEVFVKYAKFQMGDNDETICLTTDKSLKIVGDPYNITEDQFREVYEKGIDTLPTYKFTFKKNDTGYYFVSLELVK